jgi:L-lactate dehydrogenase complex protein LldE
MFSLFNESVSMALAQKKVEQALSEGADYIVSTDQSCLLHMQSYINLHNFNLKTIHIVDLLFNKEEL